MYLHFQIPQSNEGKYWFYYVDKTVTQDLLEQLTDEFLVIFEKCPSKLKKKIKSANHNAASYQFVSTHTVLELTSFTLFSFVS